MFAQTVLPGTDKQRLEVWSHFGQPVAFQSTDDTHAHKQRDLKDLKITTLLSLHPAQPDSYPQTECLAQQHPLV